METPEYIEMTPKKDIRQSNSWASFLKKLSWKSHKTKGDVNIFYRNTFLGTVVKIQHPKNLAAPDLKEIEDFCRSTRAMFIKIEPFLGQDMGIFSDFGYVKSTVPNISPSTMYIDLTLSGEKLWENVSKSGRYSIRRAQREKARVEFYKNPKKALLKTYFKVYKQTARKKHFYIPPFSNFLATVGSFGQNAHLAMVYDGEGGLCGGKMYLCFEDMVLYSTGGTTELGRKGKFGYELLWQSILYFKKLGYKVLDLEGVDDDRFANVTKKWGGFSYFKEKFGGEIVRFPYPQIKYLSLSLKILSKVITVPL